MTDVAILGCGVVGAAIAYELSQIPGLQVTLLDRQAPASGSTGAALGVLMGAISHKTKGRAWRLREASLRRYETLIPELETLTGKSIPYNRQGILRLQFGAEDLAKWQKLVDIRRFQGWNLEIWDRNQLQSRCPQVRAEKVIGGIYSPQDRQVNPTLLTQALVTGAAQNGVNCQFGVKVEKITYKAPKGENKGYCSEIQTTEGILKVDWLVIAAGLGSTSITADFAQTVDIRPVLGQALQIKLNLPLADADFQPVITGDDLNIVPLGKGEYWIGATVEFPNHTGEVIAKPELLAQVKQKAIAFCPQLAEGQIVQTWSGKRPRPEGQPAPIIGHLPGYQNVLLATGHYRNGVLLAPATAQKIREFIVTPV